MASPEFLSVLGGAGSVLVGFLASPALELLKTKLLAKSVRSERKREVVAKLRIMLGYMDAFDDNLRRALPHAPSIHSMEPDELAAWKEVQAFDIGAVRDHIGDLARLELEVSGTSGVGQALVKRIISYSSAVDQVKLLEPNIVSVYEGVRPSAVAGERPRIAYADKHSLPQEAQSTLSHFQICNQSLRLFIAGPYAKVLAIDRLSTVLDREILAHERAVANNEIERKLAEGARLREVYEQQRGSQGSD